MKLNEYLAKKRIGTTRAAKELKITRQRLCQVLLNQCPAGRKLAQRIKEWSGNRVTYEDLWE